MQTFLTFIKSAIITVGAVIGGFFGFHQSSSQIVGATVPVTTAFYQDSLQAGITKTATSFTLVNGKDNQGVSLNGFYGFVIDQGSASQEIVSCSSVVGINATGCTRGLDLTNATTSVAALEQVHNRGASVQITTAPVTTIIANIMRGVESIPQPIFYANDLTQAQWNALPTTTIPNIAFVNRLTTAGAANSSETVNGISQLATGAQASSGTSLGSTGGRLVIPASIATSTCQTVGNSVLISSSTTGKLDGNCFDGTYSYTQTGANTFLATTSIAASSVTGNALKLNGINYSFPVFQGASSTSLITNGAGGLSWGSSNTAAALVKDGATYSTGSTATTTLVTYTIPPNSISQSGMFNYSLMRKGTGNTDRSCLELAFGSGVSTTTLGYACGNNGGDNDTTYISGFLRNLNSMSFQVGGMTPFSRPGTAFGTGAALATNISTFYIATTTAVNLAVTSYLSLRGVVVSAPDQVTSESFILQAVQ